MRALIVDDSKAMRMIIARTLRELGFEILEAANGREALACLDQGREVQLMLVDWNMPEMNGYDLVCAIRANALLCDVMIMMVTTESCMESLRKALDAGANEYLMKPFTKDALAEKLALLGVS